MTVLLINTALLPVITAAVTTVQMIIVKRNVPSNSPIQPVSTDFIQSNREGLSVDKLTANEL